MILRTDYFRFFCRTTCFIEILYSQPFVGRRQPFELDPFSNLGGHSPRCEEHLTYQCILVGQVQYRHLTEFRDIEVDILYVQKSYALIVIIASYYRQLSVDIKIQIIRFKPVLTRTGSNPADINRFRSLTVKYI